jgi:hypothetical protein
MKKATPLEDSSRTLQLSVVHNQDPVREMSLTATVDELSELFGASGFSVEKTELWFQGTTIARTTLLDVLLEHRYNTIINQFRKLRGQSSRRIRHWERILRIFGYWILRKKLPKAHQVRKLITHKHLLAIDTFLNSNRDYLLVIEDDAIFDNTTGASVFSQSLLPLLSNHENTAPPLFVNLTFGNGSSLPLYVDTLGTEFNAGAVLVSPGQPDTLCGYMMNRSLAEKLAEKYVEDPALRLVVPDVAWQGLFPELNLSSVHLTPPLVIHGTTSGSFASWR